MGSKIRNAIDRDLLACIAASNLLFIKTWTFIHLRPSNANLYFFSSPTLLHYAALWFILMAVGVALRVIVQACRSENKWIARPARILLIAAAVVILNVLRHYIQSSMGMVLFDLASLQARLGIVGIMALASAGVAVAGVVFVRAGNRIAGAFCGIFLITSPHLLSSGYLTARALIRHDFHSYRVADRNAPLPKRVGPPVQVHIFDEWDYRLTFEAARTPKPEITRLRETVLSADRVTAWDSETNIVIPTYVTGFPMKSVEYRPDTSLMKDVNGNAERWLHAAPNLFERARARGYHTAVFGYHHPYCRLFGADLESCREYRLFGFQDSSAPPMTWALDQLPFVNDRPRYKGHAHALYSRAIDEFFAITDERTYDFVYSHWPFPHGPFIKADGSEGDYDDNMNLTDRVIGRLRKSLEQKGTWDESFVLLTADHWYRMSKSDDHRIPLFIKLPHQKKGIRYTKPYNAIKFYSIVDAALAGEIDSETKLLALLDAPEKEPQAPPARDLSRQKD